MTDEHWQAITEEILGLWGSSGRAEFEQRRLRVWANRWKTERYSVMQAVLHELELRTRPGWPAPGEVHATVAAVKQRFQFRLPGRAEPPEAEGPLSAAEWFERADWLWAAAADRVASGRGVVGDRWHRYLSTLAEFYADNGARVESGHQRLWPPPSIGGFFGRVLDRFVDGRDRSAEDARDRARRTAHVPPERDA